MRNVKKIGVLFLFIFLVNYFIQQRCIKLIKSDSKGSYNTSEDLYFK